MPPMTDFEGKRAAIEVRFLERVRITQRDWRQT
jgi:hypothetical protein